MPNGLTVGRADHVGLTEVRLQPVYALDRAGDRLLTLGESGVVSKDAAHFHMPTNGPSQRMVFYISDEYRNSRIAKFSSDGEFIPSWGSQRTGAGQFDVSHSMTVSAQGCVYVADRGHASIQILEADGRYLRE